MQNKTWLLTTVLAVAGFAQVTSAVPGSPGLYLVDTSTGATAFRAASGGIASFAGALGDYSVNISASGTTIAGGTTPDLDLDVASATAGPGATTLQVYYSDGPFGPTSASYTLATVGPVVGTASTYAYYGATLFSTNGGNLLGGGADTYPYTLNATGAISASSYYLTLEYVISGSLTSIDSHFTTTAITNAPLINMPSLRTNGLVLSWPAIQGLNYQLQYKTNLTQASWLNLGNPVTASSNVLSATNAFGSDKQRFYRVQQQ